ncbi:hypothetical protein BKA61DRAFT_576256 [Leptodontidium sp. MPI-SDFR-AT-0119]|nr:hypothetical protein BKA61DRAFT_576256 [Leptodontidium sp. MPI-SDFR-AT-0119]
MNLQVLLTFGAVYLLQVGVTTAQISQCGSATACTTTLTCDRATIDGVLRFTCGTNGAVNFSPAGNSQNGRFHVFHRIPQDACYGATIGGTQRFFTVPGNGDCENFVPKSSGEPSVVTFGNVTSPGSSPGTPPGGSPPGGAPPGGSPPGGTPPGGSPPGGSPPQNPPSKPPTGENGQGGCSRQQILSGQATCVRNGPCCATPGGCPISRTLKGQNFLLHLVAVEAERFVSVHPYLAPPSRVTDPALQEIVTSVVMAVMDVVRTPL